jgi:hydrogenase maturation protein HypF
LAKQGSAEVIKRLRIKVYGIVQGVGFRPFVKRLASGLGIGGSVCNKGPYVEIFAESGERQLAAFLRLLKEEAPARAQIVDLQSEEEPARGQTVFTILDSGSDEGVPFVSPDIGICPDCARELFDKRNRRYLHPFINCTACGPRLTILDSLPYDRVRTSMAGFKMCKDCENEYSDQNDRRYHAQPVCCNDCGPRLRVLGRNVASDREAIELTREVISGGGIAAVKGIGGFHLCCDAGNEHTVARLRKLKSRPTKPFAVMARDIEAARGVCMVGQAESELLQSPARPIVLMKKCGGQGVCSLAAPGNPRLGVMLPYAPVQMLIFDYPDGREMPRYLVMTSGNDSGAPICRSDADAMEQLKDKCDLILSNDRDIRLRADDSVVASDGGVPRMVRRSRGYAPSPLIGPTVSKTEIFAAGGELKNTFCLVSDDRYYLSPYIGNLGDLRSVEALGSARERLCRLLRITPHAAACDLHPGYNSTAYALGLGLPTIRVQHHFAHILSCMTENGLGGEVIGAALDGTGLGPDGTVWGGEFLKVSCRGFKRLGSLSPYTMQGGDLAAAECFRPAYALLRGTLGEDAAGKTARELGLCPEETLAMLRGATNAGINCSVTTSAGRFFDAAAALLGLKSRSSFEGEAATALEAEAEKYGESAYPRGIKLLQNEKFEINIYDVIQYIVTRRLAGDDAGMLAAQFHDAAAKAVLAGCEECRRRTGLGRVALSGGCFQNLLLLSRTRALLEGSGFEVYTHSLVPANDGGLALGQAAAAAAYFGDSPVGGQ